MGDTGFMVPDDKIDRFAANYGRGADKSLRARRRSDDERLPQAADTFLSGGGGLVSTTADYLRFAQMLLQRRRARRRAHPRPQDGRADDAPTTCPDGGELREFALPGGYGEVGFDGAGFGLTMAVSLGPVANRTIGTAGEFMWGGAASTIFWVDPTEELVVVFMTQLMPSGTFNFRGQLKTLVYPAIVD